MATTSVAPSWVVAIEAESPWRAGDPSRPPAFAKTFVAALRRADWSIRSLSVFDRGLNFVDLLDPNAPYHAGFPLRIQELIDRGEPLPDIGPGARELPVVAAVTVAAAAVEATRGKLSFSIVIAEVRDELSRSWANRILHGRALESFPLGTGFVASWTMFIDLGGAVCFGTLSDGNPSPKGDEQIQAWDANWEKVARSVATQLRGK